VRTQPEEVLGRRALIRALLERQMLLPRRRRRATASRCAQ
jgi:hypothetical protein